MALSEKEGVMLLRRCPTRIALVLASALVGFALLTLPGLTQAAPRPNFVVIQTDDQSVAQFSRSWIDSNGRKRLIMPNVTRLLRQQGVRFSSYITPVPTCAPSRSSLLSGNYAHNHGVISNKATGGWNAYRSRMIYEENLPVWLQRAGYRTAHFGKFLNFYEQTGTPADGVVPPGWDRWSSDYVRDTSNYYGYSTNEDGVSAGPFGDPLYGPDSGRDPVDCPWLAPTLCNYNSDRISLAAVDQIESPGSRPFYVQIDFNAPHGDRRPPIGPEPAPRHLGSAKATPRPFVRGFNERDISDKPIHVQRRTRLTQHDAVSIRQYSNRSAEALRSVDEAVGWIIGALRDSGELKNTYVIFTSDNGYFLGQHRYAFGKLLPYEPAIEVPMVIRGPGIRPGSTSAELVANQDLAPTILELAGASAGRRFDGRPMAPFWRNPARRSRRAILLSSYSLNPPAPAASGTGAASSSGTGAVNYTGVRIGPYKYIEYESGEWELYDLRRDPGELQNKALMRSWTQVRLYMRSVLRDMRGCRAAECRSIQRPWPPAPSPADERRWG
jgi:arylsulfatase A-like enzyme